MSDKIQFTCPECSHTMQLPAAVEGKQGKCPSCSATVTVTNNGMVDLASLQQQPIPEQTKPSPTQPVQQPAATTDVPLEMGTIAFAEENLTPGETILHGGRFYPYHVLMVKAQFAVFLLFFLVWLGWEIIFWVIPFWGEEVTFFITRPFFWINVLTFVGLPVGGILFCLWVQYRWAYNKDQKTEFVLTNQRLIAKWGFLRTVIREIQLDKIESVNYGQTLRERWLFGIGRLTVKGTGGSKVGKFKYLLDALEFRRRILAQIDRMQT